MTKDEMHEVDSWRNESSDHAKAFSEAKNLWLSLQRTPEPDQQVLDRILEDENKDTMTIKSKTNGYRYAVAAVVVLGIAVGAFFLSNSDPDGLYKLDDGSEILVHRDSKLTGIRIDEVSREVTLEGKAHFMIAKDDQRPFIVKTEHARVEVLGTSFVIDSYHTKTEVTVETGLVNLVKPGVNGKADLSIKVSEGEVGTVKNMNKGILKKNNRNQNYLSWKTKSLEFEWTYMSEIKTILEDVYDIKVSFEDPSLKKCRITAKLEELEAEDAVAIIAKTFNLAYEIKGKNVIFKGKGC